MFLAVNTNAALVRRAGWNTFLVRAVGNRHVVFLNGKQVNRRLLRVGVEIRIGTTVLQFLDSAGTSVASPAAAAAQRCVPAAPPRRLRAMVFI